MGDQPCGIFMPSGYWWQDGNKWKYYCKLNWPRLKEMNPKAYDKWEEKFGPLTMDQWGYWSWPSPCCGAKFIPWARGASKVLEFYCPKSHKWWTLVAERLPQVLDDEIKKKLNEWHEICGHVTAEDIMKHIPEVWPKTHVLDEFPGVGKFDILDWQRKGEPTLTCAGWIALVECIARTDVVNWEHIITLCGQLKNNLSLYPTLAEAASSSSRG